MLGEAITLIHREICSGANEPDDTKDQGCAHQHKPQPVVEAAFFSSLFHGHSSCQV